MFTIRESETFPIVRKLADPADSATYYVRAVVRNAISGATLNTVNLTNDGNSIQRFVGTFTAPTDASGQGLYIDIVTKVYTDSGYTTQDSSYSDEVETYLVGQRWNYNLANNFGGGGAGMGSDINYKKIREIVKEEVSKIEKVEIKDYTKEFDSLKKIVDKEIVIPKTDLGPVETMISSISDKLFKMDEMHKKEKEDAPMKKMGENLESKIEEKVSKILDTVTSETKKLTESVKELENFISEQDFTLKLNIPSNMMSIEKKESKREALMKGLQ